MALNFLNNGYFGGKLGIGTDSPNRKLTIQNGSYTYPGGIDANSFFAIANNGWAGMNILSSNTTGGFIDFGDLGGGHRGRILYGQSTDYMSFDTAGSTKMTILSGGNVGIGNTSPGAKLVVGSNVNSNATGIEVNAGASGGNVLSNGTADNWFPYIDNNNYYSASEHIFRNELNSDTRMIIKSSGNVGIGTTLPGYKLDVVGSIKASVQGRFASGSAAAPSYSFDADSDSGMFRATTNALGFSTAAAERMRINSQGQTWLGGYYTGADIANGNTSYLNNLNAGGFSVLHRNAADVYLHFNTYYNSSNNYVSKYSATAFRVDAPGNNNGLSFHKAPSVAAGSTQTFSSVMTVGYGTNNYVGIGTTSPIGKLNVSKDSTTDGLSQAITVSSTSVSTKRMNLGYVPGSNYAFIDVINYGISNTNQALSLQPNGGNVGIGTTNPSKPLDVRTDTGVLIKGASGSTNAKISLLPASGGRQYDLGNVGSDFRIFDASANVTRMYFDNDGNTGIGTTSPSAKLDVAGKLYVKQTDDSEGIKIFGYDDRSAYSGNLYIDSAGNFQIRQTHGAGSGYMQIHAENYLELHAGSLIYTQANFRIYDAGTLSFGSGGDYKMKHNSVADNLIIHTDDNKGITIDNAGNVTFTEDIKLKGVSISNQENLDVDTGIDTIATVVKANYDAAFFDYVIKNGTNLRAGTVMAVHDGTNVEFTDNSTRDIGDTSGVTLSVDISGTDLRLRATTTSDNWIIKTLVKSI